MATNSAETQTELSEVYMQKYLKFKPWTQSSKTDTQEMFHVRGGKQKKNNFGKVLNFGSEPWNTFMTWDLAWDRIT